MNKFKLYVILIVILLVSLLAFQAMSGLFDSQSPENKILELMEKE